MSADEPHPAEPARTTGPGAIVRILGSLRFALSVVGLIAAACVAGTLIPQGHQAARYVEHNPAARGRIQILEALGLTHVFFASWFVGLLFVLAASLIVCTWRRCRAIRETAGPKRIRVAGSLLTHLSLLLVLIGGTIRGLWGDKGTLDLREGQTTNRFIGQRGPVSLPFSVRLVDFNVEWYGAAADRAQPARDRLLVSWPEQNLTNAFPVLVGRRHEVRSRAAPHTNLAFTIAILRQEPDFFIDAATREVGSRSAEPNNPAVLVSVTGEGRTTERWVFARFPDFDARSSAADKVPLRFRYLPSTPADAHPPQQVKEYRSQVQILREGSVVQEKSIKVNLPLSYGGYTLYQFSYDPRDLAFTSLQIVRDPGVAVVYAGFALMMAGLTVVFWLAPSMETAARQKARSP
jgi:cytochrome c biogenesis protein ResB